MGRVLSDTNLHRTLVGDYVRPRILSRFDEAEKRKLIKFCFGARGVGDYMEIGFFATFRCETFNFLVTDTDIENALRAIPDAPKNVYYDGGRGWHVYEDKELEYQVQILTLALALEKEKFIEIFDAQEESVREKFRHNSHGMSEKDKVEPFDLLSTYSTWNIIGQTAG